MGPTGPRRGIIRSHRPITRPPSGAAAAALGVALALALTAVGGCGTEPGGDARRVALADAEALLVVPALEPLRARTVAFLAGIEGTSGVLELLAGRYGLDLRTPEGLAQAGIDGAQSLVACEKAGAVVVAVGTSDPGRFRAVLAERFTGAAGATLAPPAGDAGVTLVTGPSAAPMPSADGAPTEAPAPEWRAAYGVTADRVGIVVVTPAGADPAALWQTAAGGDGSAVRSELAAKARERAGQGAVLWGYTGDVVPPAPAGLGLASNVVEPALDGLQHVYGGVELAPDRLRVHLAADHVGERELPVAWLTPEGSADVFADVFPKTTVAFLRLRMNLGRVRKIPRILRDSVMPSTLPGLSGLPLPALSDLVDLVEGDVAVAILGVADAASLTDLGQLQRGPGGFERALHVALAARARDSEGLLGAFGGIASQLETSGWTVAPIAAGGYRGWAFAREARAYSALIGHGVVLFIVGRGEVEPFLAVAEKRALPIASLADGEPTVAAALGKEPATLGFVASFTRLTRELADKGVPPYFLKILNDIRVIGARVDVGERRVGVDLDVSL